MLRCRTSQDPRVIVCPDGSLSLEQQRQEREDARMLVESDLCGVLACWVTTRRKGPSLIVGRYQRMK
ncbi:hypothetical protein NDU88_003001 [Pleurodeles waltl]|uniref:Uncharacterized protein n=1 Tax=Pleurodeles waltl TaxID=8319 RepID=A0AAV7NPQ8_PLEWA|nr:hypothetical protein NDU88_003001 [Pleurodeles waltl]